eukprot:CAMPEP_0204377320 /NCGR_PEP_ID=MMETSP0469-20131031/50837_1 /ASSEMBLY_ACC=CAM_ASM_000384 /TAXON_ID=2969 /ORGANISM="Oxyrrhis marina" /LENGTH=136 /DNA_ID=CAMNT_0051368363 /DNA_START=48 /DNA_END=459 /DNA_ORIENTATION=+
MTITQPHIVKNNPQQPKASAQGNFSPRVLLGRKRAPALGLPGLFAPRASHGIASAPTPATTPNALPNNALSRSCTPSTSRINARSGVIDTSQAHRLAPLTQARTRSLSFQNYHAPPAHSLHHDITFEDLYFRNHWH